MESTNETILEGIRNHTKFVFGSSGFMRYGNGGVDIQNLSGDAATNKAAWDRAYQEYGHLLGLNGTKAYLYLLGQLMHESGSFRSMVENTDGKKYQNKLGNTQPGDGPRFIGRGPIQVTGRSNYEKVYKEFFIPNGLAQYDIVNNPNLGADPYIGSLMSIGWILCTNNGKRAIEACNRYDIVALTKAINGGFNGLERRKAHTENLLIQNNLQ